MIQRARAVRLAAFSAVVALAFAAPVSADTTVPSASLPRRGLLGAAVDEQQGKVFIRSIIAGLPAESAGLLAQDTIVAVNGDRVTSVAEFLRAVRGPSGRSLELTIRRGGQTLQKSVVLVEAPKEHDPQVVTDYDAVDVDGSLRRTLVTSPRNGTGGRRAAVLFIGGIGCYSIDLPSELQDPYALLAHDLSRHGFITLRLEKSGVGDSQGAPCASTDFDAEARSYGIALEALRSNPLVDPKRLYLFGHSIGTVIAPRLAAQNPVAGIVVAEAVAKNWFEYELINVQRQLQLAHEKPADIDNAVAGKEFCMHELLIERQPRSKILHDRPNCSEHMAYPAPDSYLQEVAALNLAQAWTKVTVPVLVVYGRADFETDEADHQRIADIVNAQHPKSATYQIIDDMDHLLTVARSQQASYDDLTQGKRQPYDTALGRVVLQWLSRQAKQASTARGPADGF